MSAVSADSSLAGAGLPKMSDIYSNIQAPSISDLGGSLGDKATSLNAPVAAANTANQNTYANMPSPWGVYQNLESQNGIPQLKATSRNLQENVNNLENQIFRVVPNVSANDANSLVTESQRQGQVAAQQYPLQLALTPQATALGNINNEIGTAETGIGNEVNAVNAGNANTLQAGGQNISAAEDMATRAQTGYTQDAQNMLQGLLQKMQIQGTLDAAEWQTLSTLAEKKQEYDNNIKVAQVRNQYQTLSPTQSLVNTFTGKTYQAPTP